MRDLQSLALPLGYQAAEGILAGSNPCGKALIDTLSPDLLNANRF